MCIFWWRVGKERITWIKKKLKRKVKVVELTLEDGSKMLCRGGEEMVRKSWDLWPVVSARWTGEEETMQWLQDE